MTRRTVLAVALVAALGAIVAGRGSRDRAATPPHAADLPPPAVTAPLTARPDAPSLDEPGAPIPAIDPPAIESVEHRDAVAFADDYAAAVCACRDAACVDDTRDEFAARLGEALPTRDTAALAASLARADACADAWRAAAADQPSTIRTSPGNAAGS